MKVTIITATSIQRRSNKIAAEAPSPSERASARARDCGAAAADPSRRARTGATEKGGARGGVGADVTSGRDVLSALNPYIFLNWLAGALVGVGVSDFIGYLALRIGVCCTLPCASAAHRTSLRSAVQRSAIIGSSGMWCLRMWGLRQIF